MKKFTKVLAVCLAVLCVGFAFAGCGETTDTAKDDTKTTDTAKTDSDTQGEIIMATNAEFPPFEYMTQTGLVDQYDGIDVAIMKEVAAELNMKLVINNMEFGAIIPAVTSGKADIAVAGMTADDERRESLDFTDTYWTAVQTIVVKSDNTDIINVDGLSGKTVGVATNYTGDLVLTDVSEEKNIIVKRYTRGIDAIEELKNGKLDAVVIDSPTADNFIKQNDTLKGVSDDEFFGKEEYAMGVKKGNTELLDKVNGVLKEMKASGRLDEIGEEVNQRLQTEEIQ